MFVRRAIVAGVVLAAASDAAAQGSHNVTLLGQQNLYSAYASCWGWTGPGGQEFALIGASTGTSIVDVSVPTAPAEKSFISGVSSSWREMKTYDRYAYIVTEGSGGGLQIVDLAASPPALVATYNATFTTAHTITIVGSWAYVNGARLNGSQVGIRFLDLANPTAPVDRGGWNGYYTHDCQVRNDTLWAACISSGLVAVVDVRTKSAPVLLRTFTWPGCVAHNCDLTQDGKYLLTTDETPTGHLHVFDVSDLSDIRLAAEWTANPSGIIHNVHIRGDLAYCAYYTEGVRVVDISDPEYPVEVGWYDTWPGASGSYNGNWEAYPYAASGNAYLSDISTGLYIVRFEQPDGSVSGTVREAGAGTPLASAEVALVGGPSTSSNSSGFYKLFHTPGLQTLVTSLFGFYADTTTVTLVQGVNVHRDVDLTRLPGLALEGTVRSAAGGALLDAASVVIDGAPLVAQSDGSGHYGFTSVPYGVYALTASRFGYAPERRSVTVSQQAPGTSVTADFDLEPAALATDFEPGPAGWARVTASPPATSGLWEWADPVGSGGGGVQPEDDHTPAPGAKCWVTGNATSPSDPIGQADVDGGATILQSPVFDVSALANPTLSYWRWFSNNAGSNPGTDTLHVLLSNNGGTTWKVVEKLVQTQAQWVQVTVPVAALLAPTSQMRLRVVAEDLGAGSVVEAAFDDFMAFDAPATSAVPSFGADRLVAAVPNPFNPTTRLRFELGEPGRALLHIYDARGALVRVLGGEALPAGLHERAWDGRDGAGRRVASGVYLVRLETPRRTAQGRVVLVK